MHSLDLKPVNGPACLHPCLYRRMQLSALSWHTAQRRVHLSPRAHMPSRPTQQPLQGSGCGAYDGRVVVPQLLRYICGVPLHLQLSSSVSKPERDTHT